MGARGYGIFQSDATMDVADQIDDDFAKLANDAEMKLCCPEDHEKVAAKLNEGVLDQLFKGYSEIGWDYGLFYLDILSMQLGANLSLEKITLLKDITERIKEYPLTKQQMEKGLREYKVGVPYDFESLSLIDTMSSRPAGSGRFTAQSHEQLAHYFTFRPWGKCLGRLEHRSLQTPAKVPWSP